MENVANASPAARRGRPAKSNKIVPKAHVTGLHDSLLEKETYTPDNLIDSLAKVLKAGSDAELARTLRISAPIISKIRSRRTHVSTGVLVRMHDVTQLPINELRRLMGVTQVVFGPAKGKK